MENLKELEREVERLPNTEQAQRIKKLVREIIQEGNQRILKKGKHDKL